MRVENGLPQEVVRVLVTHFGVNERDYHAIRPSPITGRYQFKGKVSGSLIHDRSRWRVVLHPEAFSLTKGATEWASVQCTANRVLAELPTNGAP
ncbi:MAG TPA: hypothetical protein VJ837_01720 [Candidatus Paceibacterota bacterium]|nr:hypothetical protein [Candidatus Paceibacterota bacterium]